MWAISDKGFISAVEYRPGKDRTHQLPEALQPPEVGASRKVRRRYERATKNGFILARARVAEDLEQLRPYFAGLTVMRDQGADYKWRCVLPRTAFAKWAYDVAMGIDYDSHFKEAASRRSSKDPERYPAMMACWTALNRMGRERPAKAAAPYPVGNTAPFGHGGKPKSTAPWHTQTSTHFDWDAWRANKDAEKAEEDARIEDARITAERAAANQIARPSSLTDMATTMLSTPLRNIVVDEETADDAFDLWTEASDAWSFIGDQPLTPEQLSETVDALIMATQGHEDEDTEALSRLSDFLNQDQVEQA